MENRPTDSSAEASAPIREVGEQERFTRLIDTEERLLVDFYADWCGPCQSMARVVEELASETDVPIVRVNVEESPLLAHQFDVRALPTILGLRHGEEVDRLVGVQQRADLEGLLD